MIKMYNEELGIKQDVHNEIQVDAFKKYGFEVVEEYPETENAEKTLDKMKQAELKEICESEGIEVPSGVVKNATLIELIETSRASK